MKQLLVVAAVVVCAMPARAQGRPSAKQVYGLAWAHRVDDRARSVPELLTPRWKHREFAGPALHKPSGLIYIGSSDRQMRAFDSGRQLVWSFEAGGAISSNPVVGELLYFGADDARVYGLELGSGKQVFSHQADAEVTGPVRLANGLLYFATALDTLYCLDARSGEYRWHVRRPQPLGITLFGNAAPALGSVLGPAGEPQPVVAMGYADGSVALFDAQSGRELWRAQVGKGEAFYDVDADPVIVGPRLIAAAALGGVQAFELATGKPLWHADLDGLTRLSHDGPVLVGGGAHRVVGIDVVSGKLLWTFGFEHGTASRPVFDQGRVLVNSDRGALFVLDLFSGEPLQTFGSPLGRAGAPAVADDLLVVYSNGGWLYALSSQFAGWAQPRL